MVLEKSICDTFSILIFSIVPYIPFLPFEAIISKEVRSPLYDHIIFVSQANFLFTVLVWQTLRQTQTCFAT